MIAWLKRYGLAAAVPGAIAAGWIWVSIPDYSGELDHFEAVSTVRDRDGNPLRVVLSERETLCNPVPLDQMGTWTAKAVVAFEDKRFYEHGGVDTIAVCRAMLHNVRRRRVVSGASTLSTLVVKLTEPRNRTPWTKVVEAHHALQLEGQLSKGEILEQYLNRTPFGGNVYGIEAASQRYFGKPACGLSLAESAMLVGLPQAPSYLRPDRNRRGAIRQRNIVLSRMLENGTISRAQYDVAVQQTMVLRRSSLPFAAPHFCDFIGQHFPESTERRTTLDASVQQIAEAALRQRVAELNSVRGGAVVVLDVRRGEVLSMVGAPDFWDASAAGQVNSAVARRSPGSTLKPFAYAMAMDQGLYTPASVVGDVPMHFAGYTPQNYSRAYCGPVSVRHALVQSLNIPALRCVEQVGLDSFVSRLRQLGFSTLDRSSDQYGLGIAVGGCETTLLDLVNAYACLARGGTWRPLHFFVEEEPSVEQALFSPESCYMIADILGGDERLDELVGHCAEVVLPRVAWKSGTSSGHRDAWAVAYNPDYVVGVWMGNPDGAASEELVGGSAAGPVVGEIFRRLYPEGRSPWFERPAGLRVRNVCARSGAVPCSDCAATECDDYIPRISAVAPCTVHQGNEEVWPAAIHQFLAQQRGGESESETATASDLKITAPVDGETFCLLPESPGIRQEIRFSAQSESGTPLYWFVDGQLLKQDAADRPVFWPLKKGAHTIACADASGCSARVGICVE